MSTTLRDLAHRAAERPTIYEKMEFPPKPQEGYAIVRFLDREPRSFRFVDAFTKEEVDGLSINVAILASDMSGCFGVRQLTMRADPKTSLTAGVLKLWAECGESLKGVEAYIELRNYQHDEHGESRNYTVYAKPT